MDTFHCTFHLKCFEDWSRPQVKSFYLRMETEFSLQNVVSDENIDDG